MTQTNAHHARLLPQRTFGPLHQFRKFGDRRAGFRMCFEQLHIVLRILFALARSLLRHFMFSKMVVRLSKERPQLAERAEAVFGVGRSRAGGLKDRAPSLSLRFVS